MPVNAQVRKRAATAQRINEQNRVLDDSALGAYMRRSQLGYGAPYIPKNNGEAIGLLLGRLLKQGVDEWKANYDLRGDFNREGEYYLEKQLRGDPLNPEQEALLLDYKGKYPDRYAESEARVREQLGNAPQQADVSQPTTPAAGNGIGSIGRGILGEINMPSQDSFGALPTVGNPFEALSAESLANNIPNMQEAILQKFKQDELDRILDFGNRTYF